MYALKRLLLAFALCAALLLFPAYASGEGTYRVVLPPSLEYDEMEYWGDGLFKVRVFDDEYREFLKHVYVAEKEGGKFGLVDKSGKIILPVEYDYIDNSSFLRAVKKGDKYGVIDYRGKIIVSPVLDKAEGHGYYDITIIEKDGKWGAYNDDGKRILEIEYDAIELIRDKNNSIRVLKDGKVGAVDNDGNIIIPIDYDEIDAEQGQSLLRVTKNGKVGFMNAKGKAIIPLEYDSLSNMFDDNIAIVEKDAHFGLIDTKGKEVAPIIYDDIWLRNDYAILYKDGKCGVLDYGKKINITPLMYDECMFDHNYYFLFHVRVGSNWGMIDAQGKEIIPLAYDGVEMNKDRYKYDYIPLAQKDQKWGVLGSDGKELTAFDYDEIAEFRHGLAIARKGEKLGLLHTNGKEAAPCIYDEIEIMYDLCLVRKGEKWGLLNMDGEETAPCVYDEIMDDLRDLIRARKGDKWGYLYEDGKEATPFIYDSVYKFLDKVASVEKDGKFGLIDADGKVVIPLIYDSMHNEMEGFENRPDLFFAKTGGKEGVISESGEILVPAIYDYIDLLSTSDYSLYCVRKDFKYALYKVGKGEITPLIYDNIGFLYSDGLIEVVKDGKLGYIDKRGRVIVPMEYDYVVANYSYSNNENGCVIVQQDGKFGILEITAKLSD